MRKGCRLPRKLSSSTGYVAATAARSASSMPNSQGRASTSWCGSQADVTWLRISTRRFGSPSRGTPRASPRTRTSRPGSSPCRGTGSSRPADAPFPRCPPMGPTTSRRRAPCSPRATSNTETSSGRSPPWRSLTEKSSCSCASRDSSSRKQPRPSIFARTPRDNGSSAHAPPCRARSTKPPRHAHPQPLSPRPFHDDDDPRSFARRVAPATACGARRSSRRPHLRERGSGLCHARRPCAAPSSLMVGPHRIGPLGSALLVGLGTRAPADLSWRSPRQGPIPGGAYGARRAPPHPLLSGRRRFRGATPRREAAGSSEAPHPLDEAWRSRRRRREGHAPDPEMTLASNVVDPFRRLRPP